MISIANRSTILNLAALSSAFPCTVSSLLTPSLSYTFSTRKRIKETDIILQSSSKLDPMIKGQKIYETSKTQSFSLASLLFSMGFGACAYIFYNQQILLNFLPMILTFATTILYQLRIMNTIKSMIVDKNGDKLIIDNYGLFGVDLFSKSTIVPIHIMSGVARKKINKAVVVRGGGKFGIPEFQYYFHELGVRDRVVFNHVVSGKKIEYTDTL